MENTTTATNTPNIEDKLFLVTAGRDYKSMMLTSEAILFCSKTFKTGEEFRKTFDEVNGKTLTLTSTVSIPYSSLTKVSSLEKSNNLNLKFDGIKITWPSQIEFSGGPQDVNLVMDFLEKKKGYRRSVFQQTPFKAILPNLGYLVLTAGAVWLLYRAATGVMHESNTAKGKAMDRLLKFVGDMLGPTGVLVLGFAAIGVVLWFLIKKLQEPPMEVILEG